MALTSLKFAIYGIYSLMDALLKLYAQQYACSPTEVTAISPHASKRQLFRLVSPQGAAVGVINEDIAENKAFIAFTHHFESLGLPVPTIYQVAPDYSCYLEDDLGDYTLYQLLLKRRAESSSGQFPEDIEHYYCESVKWLAHFQVRGQEGFPYEYCYESETYDVDAMAVDMRAFRDQFLDVIGVKYHNESLERDFKDLQAFLAQADSDFFLYRDFQGRNIMVRDEKLYFIDYQSGRKGPLQYDLVSLLFQSQAKIPTEVRARILSCYLDQLVQLTDIDTEQFMRFYDGYVYMRLMQVLGAYGKLGLTQRKPYFLRGVPIAIENLLTVLETRGLPVELPELRRVFETLGHYDVQTEKCTLP